MGSFGFAKRRKPFLDKGSFIGVAISTNHWVLHDLLRDWANRILRNAFFADTCCRYNVFNQGVLTDTTNMYGIYIAHICLYIYIHIIYKWSTVHGQVQWLVSTKSFILAMQLLGLPVLGTLCKGIGTLGFPHDSWQATQKRQECETHNATRMRAMENLIIWSWI